MPNQNDCEIPRHLRERYGSARNYRQKKREEWREVHRALGQFATGSAFIPPEAYEEFQAIKKLTKSVTRRISRANWKR